ncbi:hypothetical protein HanIR_Chr13g0631901 [Helianthus annuus]|nr:hypothetical protein HanIR_Chr13g0631901 [Helianthus annuus]
MKPMNMHMSSKRASLICNSFYFLVVVLHFLFFSKLVLDRLIVGSFLFVMCLIVRLFISLKILSDEISMKNIKKRVISKSCSLLFSFELNPLNGLSIYQPIGSYQNGATRLSNLGSAVTKHKKIVAKKKQASKIYIFF